jgi:hypothetical protein
LPASIEETFQPCPLELLAIKKFPKRPLAPATEKSYFEAGVLLATDYGELRNFHELANVMAAGYGKNACQQKVIAYIWVVLGSLSLSSLSLSLSLSRSLSLPLSLSFSHSEQNEQQEKILPKPGIEPQITV